MFGEIKMYIKRKTKSGYAYVSAHRHTDRQTDRHTEVKTVYPLVSLRSLGGYKTD